MCAFYAAFFLKLSLVSCLFLFLEINLTPLNFSVGKMLEFPNEVVHFVVFNKERKENEKDFPGEV